ncbi:type II toxin-antitoxin system mRNA interferase toxin, RelE/StbE family [Patescibacteria group bacterium]|nr:type II toxin-antitoxin system mRNA interferase toxin, RelE/StbE family [Patescibacteria group bacterium]
MQIKIQKSCLRKLNKYKKKDIHRYRRILLKIELFKTDINNSSLRVHKLTGKYGNYWSFSVEEDLRIIYIYKDEITFVDIGTHNEVYR